jgi:hypothetical protein
MNHFIATIQALSPESLSTTISLPLITTGFVHGFKLILGNLSAAAVSFVAVELGRDLFHDLGHHWKPLKPAHMMHHTAYKPGFVVYWKHFYGSLAYYEIPEAIVMVLIASAFCGVSLASPAMADSLLGCLFSLFQTVTELVIKILRWRGVKWAIEQDTTHVSGPLPKPPTCWWVNLAYHWRHHFSDINAYISGKFTLYDKLRKTALSLKGRSVAFTSPLGELDHTLPTELQRAGARVLPKSDPIDFERTDILVLDISSDHGICPKTTIQTMEAFLATVRSNRDVVTKEVWLMVSEQESALAWASLDDLYQRYLSDWMTRRRLDAPCILRKFVVGHELTRGTSPATVARRLVGAVQRDRRNIVVHGPCWLHLLQPLREGMVSLYFWNCRNAS